MNERTRSQLTPAPWRIVGNVHTLAKHAERWHAIAGPRAEDGSETVALVRRYQDAVAIVEAPLYAKALGEGWTVDKVSMYDEEDVDGWRWTSPGGTQYDEVGDWGEPPEIPKAVRRLLEQP